MLSLTDEQKERAKRLDLDMTTHEAARKAHNKIAIRKAIKKWEKSAKGKASKKKYESGDKGKANQAKYHKKNSKQQAAKRACARARFVDVPYDYEYLLNLKAPEFCPVIGTPIWFEQGSGHRPAENTASFDRIIPQLGYVQGNVRIMSKLANVMLNNSTTEQKRSFARWILENYPEN